MALAGIAVTEQAAAPEKLSFNQHIGPILSDKCFSCHGFDAKKPRGRLWLDTPERGFGQFSVGGVTGAVLLQADVV